MSDPNKTLLTKKDGEPKDFSLQIALAMLIFLFALGFAERTINFSDPLQGLILHAAILVGIILYAAARWDHSQHKYLLGLSIVPIMRIVGLVVPLPHIPLKYWFILVNLIFFVAVLMLVQRLALNRLDLGLKLKGWPGQLLVGLSGILIGAGQFFLIGPSISSDPMRTFPNALVGAVLMLGNGFVEELAFRGMLQHILEKTLGEKVAWIYLAAVYTILTLGSFSSGYIAVTFGVSLLFSWVVWRTGSILGVSLAHALASITLFLILPGLNL